MRAEDRELLELAAKAGGIVIREWMDDQANVTMPDGTYGGWNPLARWGGGEALRLATQLDMDLMLSGLMHDGRLCVSVLYPIKDDYEAMSEPYPDGDKDAAVRRMIVKAAAKAGKAMK